MSAVPAKVRTIFVYFFYGASFFGISVDSELSIVIPLHFFVKYFDKINFVISGDYGKGPPLLVFAFLFLLGVLVIMRGVPELRRLGRLQEIQPARA